MRLKKKNVENAINQIQPEKSRKRKQTETEKAKCRERKKTETEKAKCRERRAKKISFKSIYFQKCYSGRTILYLCCLS